MADFQIENIVLKKIRTDGGTQMRVQLDPGIVGEYTALYGGDADTLPPPRVMYDGKVYWLWDGFHRHAAALAAGLKSLDCEVYRGDLEEAKWRAAGSNHKHGFRPKNEDKRQAVVMALTTRANMSNVVIAKHCGVSDPFVASIRRQLLTVSSCTPANPDSNCQTLTVAQEGGDGVQPLTLEVATSDASPKSNGTSNGQPAPSEPETRIGADGKTRRMPGQGKRKKKPKEVQEEVYDSLDQKLPPTLRDVFADQAVPEQLARIRAWQQAVQHESIIRQLTRHSSAYPYLKVMRVGELCEDGYDALRSAAELIEANLPYAMCPHCKGINAGECKGCERGCGWVPKWLHEKLIENARAEGVAL